MPPRALSVEVLPDYRLEVVFADGLRGEVDCRTLVHGDGAGVFAVLRDASVFAAAYLDCGAVSWPGGLDLAPDAMYDAIARDRVWKPQ